MLPRAEMIRRRFLVAAGLGTLGLMVDWSLLEPEPDAVCTVPGAARTGAGWLYGSARTGCSTAVGLPPLAHG